jgi:hypothetical protein
MIVVLFMRLRSQPKLNWLFAGAHFALATFFYAMRSLLRAIRSRDNPHGHALLCKGSPIRFPTAPRFGSNCANVLLDQPGRAGLRSWCLTQEV